MHKFLHLTKCILLSYIIAVSSTHNVLEQIPHRHHIFSRHCRHSLFTGLKIFHTFSLGKMLSAAASCLSLSPLMFPSHPPATHICKCRKSAIHIQAAWRHATTASENADKFSLLPPTLACQGGECSSFLAHGKLFHYQSKMDFQAESVRGWRWWMSRWHGFNAIVRSRERDGALG